MGLFSFLFGVGCSHDWGPENARCERCGEWNPRLEDARRRHEEAKEYDPSEHDAVREMFGLDD